MVPASVWPASQDSQHGLQMCNVHLLGMGACALPDVWMCLLLPTAWLCPKFVHMHVYQVNISIPIKASGYVRLHIK